MRNPGTRRFPFAAPVYRENCMKRFTFAVLATLAVLVIYKELTTELTSPGKEEPTTSPSASNFPKTNVSLELFKPHVIPDKFQEATLYFSSGSAVAYVYNASDLASSQILDFGTWKSASVAALEAALSVDPQLNLIDIGCGLGVDTIVTAMLGRRVVAIDANIENVRRLWKAVLDNGIADRVKLLHKGISDRHGTFSVVTPEIENIGHSVLVPARPGDPNVVQSILIDDLLEIIDFDRAALKINIEGDEYEALHNAYHFFNQMDIPFVMMVWKPLGESKDPNVPTFVLNFFQTLEYSAYDSLYSNNPLDTALYETWPQDIVWKRHDE